MIARENWVHAGASCMLTEKSHISMEIEFAGEMISALLFRFRGVVYAYQNQCAHMLCQLDAEGSRLFDRHGEILRCAIHGIIYQPESGISLSSICHGKRLTVIRTIEDGGQIYFADKRVNDYHG